jgi:quercetin dioxygenase-like cupin family protein
MERWDINNMTIEPHKPIVLRSDAEMRVVAINLPAGEELGDHQVHERAYVLVAAGEVEFSAGGDPWAGGAGSVVHFAPGERHAVKAISEARLVLVLSPWPGEDHPRNR